MLTMNLLGLIHGTFCGRIDGPLVYMGTTWGRVCRYECCGRQRAHGVRREHE